MAFTLCAHAPRAVHEKSSRRETGPQMFSGKAVVPLIDKNPWRFLFKIWYPWRDGGVLWIEESAKYSKITLESVSLIFFLFLNVMATGAATPNERTTNDPRRL